MKKSNSKKEIKKVIIAYTKPTAIELIDATNLTLKRYSQTFKELARYDRREKATS